MSGYFFTLFFCEAYKFLPRYKFFHCMNFGYTVVLVWLKWEELGARGESCLSKFIQSIPPCSTNTSAGD